MSIFRLLIIYLLAAYGLLAQATPALLPPEQAFKVKASLADPNNIALQFDIAKGYYLYRSKFKFEIESATYTFGIISFPQGEVHQDAYFGRVETYRDTLKLNLPFSSPTTILPQRLNVTYQGCADQGICYPPQTQNISLDAAGSLLIPSASNAMNNWLTKTPISASEPTHSLSNQTSAIQSAAPSDPPQAKPSLNDDSSRIAFALKRDGLAIALLSFFGYGLLLSLTPCVLPMVPILAGMIVKRHHISRSRAFLLSCAYVLGMALTYSVAGVAAALSGHALSNALQNVWVLGGFSLIFVALALSMLGVYELQFPTALQSRLAKSANQQDGSLLGMLTMGALSALIVGPCVAPPLAGALLYIAQTKNVVFGGLALFCMALGMGALLIVAASATHHWTPKTGPWMESIKKFFGVMLLGVAIWLISPVISPLAMMLAWAILWIGCAVFLHALDPLPPHTRSWPKVFKVIGIVLLLYGATLTIGAFSGATDPLRPLAPLVSRAPQEKISLQFARIKTTRELDERLTQAKNQHRSVLLDFYADWCVSCKEMERYTFSQAKVIQALSTYEVLQVDVTANNADDKQLLKRFNLFGPPGIIFFNSQGRENGRVIGYKNADDFLAYIHSLDAIKN